VLAQSGEVVGQLAVVVPTVRPPSATESAALRRACQLVAVALDRAAATRQLGHLALHDALTGLPNRALFRERLEQALARSRRAGDMVAALCLDLDRFKEVNDALGHPAGDRLLQEMAARLSRCVRETDTVARLGGDEFAILQVGIEQPRGAHALAQRLIEVLAEPFDLGEHRTVGGASIGVAVAPNDGGTADLLLKNADIALYRAKADGRGAARFFEAEMEARLQARHLLERDLRRGLADGRFELHYQPQVEPVRGRTVGFEALLRWRDPERGMVPPAEFIPLAEEIGLILPLGEWALRRACPEAAAWPAPLRVAVNLSPVQFRHDDLAGVVATALRDAGLTPDRLELEITESIVLHETEATLATLAHLKALGVRISMDDFGTGYSSLSYLRRFPFDKLKIDRSFVQALGGQESDAAIVRAIIGLGRSLGMTTTAKGVETREQLARLRAEGCDEVQGYYFSRPQPAEAIASMIRRDGRTEDEARQASPGRPSLTPVLT
jgi:diguanylate cyclase (GGDEF)-like protein